ncbi:MAG: flagellar basal body rod protein FlgB [Defluviitaleaceae bacterium]|nr:flagellar basal body rod protein FlgB [Defluviitaleaceae bacterium]
MFLNRMTVQNDLIGLAMHASALTNDVIQNNIANVDVPNFKRSTVVFDSVLQDVVDTARSTGVLHRDRIAPRVVLQHQNLSHRLDGNNVDIETEMVALYQNSVRFDVMAAMLQNNSARRNLAFQQ